MADATSNILIQLRGRADQADQTIDEFSARLQRFGQQKETAEVDVKVKENTLEGTLQRLKEFNREAQDEQVEIDLQVKGEAEAAAKVKAFTSLFDNLGDAEFTARVNVNASEAFAQAKAVNAALQGVIGPLPVRTEVDQIRYAEAVAQLKLLEDSFIGDIEAGVKVDVDPAALTAARAEVAQAFKALTVGVEPTVEQASFATALAQLRTLGSDQTAHVKVEVDDLATATAALKSIQNRGALSNLAVMGTVDIDPGRALGKLKTIELALDAVARPRDVNVDVDKNGRLGIVSGALEKLSGLFDTTAVATTKAGSAMSGVTVNVGAFGLKLGPVVGVVLAAGLAIAVSLVAALGLLVVAIAGAVAALGALAVAFAAALGPAVALAIGVISKFAQVLKVVKGLEDSSAAASRKSAEGAKAAAQAAETRRTRLVAIAGALRAVESAERGVQDAQLSAKDAIVAANRSQADSARTLQDANERLKQVTQDAYEAIAASSEKASDALLDVRSAKLGIEEAGLATEQAELNLRKFREEAGVASKSFDSLFKKFQDVDFQGDVGGLIGGAGGSVGNEDALKLEGLVLAVKRAKVGEAQATDTLSDREKDLTKARQEQVKFAKEGIQAYEPFRAAIKSQADATRGLAEATAKANALQSQGVAGAAGVISAKEALVNAEERLKEARIKASVNTTGGLADDAIKAREEFNKLSPSLQRFAGTIIAVKAQLKGFFDPAVDSVFNGLTRLTGSLPALLNPLKAQFSKFGATVGKILGDAGGKLSSPKVVEQFGKLIDAASELTVIFGNKIFPGLFDLFLQFSVATLPKLIELMGRFGDFLTRVSNNDGSKLSGFLNTVFTQLGSVTGLLKEMALIFAAIFGASADQSIGFVDSITNAAKGIREFLQSTEGQEAVRKFFDDLIPLAVSAIKFIIELVRFIVNIARAVAPAFGGVLSIIDTLIGAFNWVLEKLRGFLQVAVTVALFFLPGGGMFKAIIAILGKLGALKTFLTTFFDKILVKFGATVSKIGEFFKGLASKMAAPFHKVYSFLVDDFLPGMFDIGKKIVGAIAKGIKNAPKKLKGAVRGALGGVSKLLPGSEPKDPTSPLRGLGKRGRAILSNVAKGIPVGGDILASRMSSALAPISANITQQVYTPSTTPGSAPNNESRGGYVIENINLPSGPAAAIPDARYQAVQLARELSRRGGGGS